MLTFFKKITILLLHGLQNIVAPHTCFNCNNFIAQQEILCMDCTKLITPIASTFVELKNNFRVHIYAVGTYTDPLKKLILAKSYSNIRASTLLAKLIYTRTIVNELEFDIIVPIPLHWSRYAWRGFNQAQVMAKQLSYDSGKPVVHLLKRIKRTSYQSAVPGKDRQSNVKDAFVLTKSAQLYSNKKILLIDDLYTSGATIKAVAHELMHLKPKAIYGIVAARVVKD